MVQIGCVRVSVRERSMSVPVAVWFTGGIVKAVRVLVMFIVNVQVLVFHWFVDVLVFVVLWQPCERSSPTCLRTAAWLSSWSSIFPLTTKAASPPFCRRSRGWRSCRCKERRLCWQTTFTSSPPAERLSISKGALHLSELKRQYGKHVAVDLFFRTLADSQGSQSVFIKWV